MPPSGPPQQSRHPDTTRFPLLRSREPAGIPAILETKVRTVSTIAPKAWARKSASLVQTVCKIRRIIPSSPEPSTPSTRVPAILWASMGRPTSCRSENERPQGRRGPLGEFRDHWYLLGNRLELMTKDLAKSRTKGVSHTSQRGILRAGHI